MSLPAAFIKNLKSAGRPLLISWAVTHRCTRSCRYCRISKLRSAELDTQSALSVIDRLAALGTMLICFSGGEPLLRDDIGKLFSRCRKKGVAFDISSNGDLVTGRIRDLLSCRLLVLSLDGPRQVHDGVRGRGSFDRVIAAAAAVRRRGIPVYFRTVLSRHNLRSVDEILSLAGAMGIQVIFQPVTGVYYGSARKNESVPAASEYRAVVDRLLDRKRGGDRFIQNSSEVLRYLRRWPERSPIPCVSGKVFFHIFPDGKVTPCIWGRDPRRLPGVSILDCGAGAFAEMGSSRCEGCWDAAACNFNFSFFRRTDA